MIHFIIGAIVGGIAGVFGMSLANIARDADDEMRKMWENEIKKGE